MIHPHRLRRPGWSGWTCALALGLALAGVGCGEESTRSSPPAPSNNDPGNNDPGNNQDDNDEAFYLLAQGRASVTVDGTPVAELSEGECFGETGLMRGGTRSATVTGNEACTVLRIDGRLIEHAPLECQLRFTRAFLEVLSRRLVQSNRRIHDCVNQG